MGQYREWGKGIDFLNLGGERGLSDWGLHGLRANTLWWGEIRKDRCGVGKIKVGRDK